MQEPRSTPPCLPGPSAPKPPRTSAGSGWSGVFAHVTRSTMVLPVGWSNAVCYQPLSTPGGAFASRRVECRRGCVVARCGRTLALSLVFPRTIESSGPRTHRTTGSIGVNQMLETAEVDLPHDEGPHVRSRAGIAQLGPVTNSPSDRRLDHRRITFRACASESMPQDSFSGRRLRRSSPTPKRPKHTVSAVTGWPSTRPVDSTH